MRRSIRGTVLTTALILALFILGAGLAGSAAHAASLDLDRLEKLIDSGQLPAAEATELVEFSQANPGNLKAHLLLGYYYASYNLGELAAMEFESALRIDKNQPLVWVDLANVRYRHHKEAEAAKVLIEAENRFPSFYNILLARAMLFLREGRLAEAESYLAKAQTAKPDEPDTYVGQAQIFLNRKDYLAAINASDRALALKPDRGAAHLAKAQALLNLGQRSAAIRHLAIGFSSDRLNKPLAKLYLEQAEQAGLLAESCEAALVIMGIDVNSLELLEDDKEKVIGSIGRWRQSGASESDVERLIETVSADLKGTGHQAKFLFCLGDIYDRLNQRHRAIHLYRDGLAIDPTYARAYLRLGADLELSGQYAQATRLYQKAYSIKKEDPEIARRERRMANRANDLAWCLRDLILRITNPSPQHLD